MKKKFTRENGMRYILGTIVSILGIFVRKDGLDGIKLGMDLAGGVRLSYLIDYTKYDAKYENSPADLAAAKKSAKDIITAQIDQRISALGVANYTSQPQMLNDKEYMVIELGGVSDVDEAKQTIGKTVELEFALENEDVVDQADRKKFAQKLLQKASDVDLEHIGKTNATKAVSYDVFTGELSILPTIYQKQNMLDGMKDGELSPKIAEGVFLEFPEEAKQQGYEDQKGFVITRLLSKKKTTRDNYTAGSFIGIVPDAKISVTRRAGKKNVATYADGKLVYLVKEMLPNQAGLKIEILNYTGDVVESGLAQIKAGQKNIAESIYSGRLALDKAPLAVPGFVYQEGEERATVPHGSGHRIVHIEEVKKTDEKFYQQYEYTVNEERAKKIIDTLKNPVMYEIETVFISDKQPRKLATDTESGEILNGKFFDKALVGTTQFGETTVNIAFNNAGKKIFCNITAANIKKQMAIFVGGKLKTNPVIQDKICGGETQITGDFTKEQAQNLAKELNEGALPAPLVLVQEEKVSPILGIRALEDILLAGLIGVIGVFIYMGLMYGWRRAGVSLVILVVFALFTVMLLKIIGAALGLSGLAAIILSLGMSVDATILVFERIIENRKNGQPMKDSIIDASEQAWSAVRDGQLSTGMIALLLMFMGVNIFKGFGTMMALNIFVIVVLIYPLIKILSLKCIRKTK